MKKFINLSALVVDDHIETLEIMKEYLEIEFSTIYTATSTDDAFNIVLEKKPNIIFTDIKMPNEDGFSFVKRMMEKNLNIPVVIISAYDHKEKLFEAIRLNIIDYLVKPINSKKLQDTIRLYRSRLNYTKEEIKLRDNYVWKIQELLLFKDGKIVKLTQSERKFLDILIQNIDRPIKSIDIFYHIWDYGTKEYSEKSIRNVVYKLRKKLGEDNFIENIYGRRYIIRSVV